MFFVSIIFVVVAAVMLYRLSPALLMLLCAVAYLKPDWLFTCLNSKGLRRYESGRRFVAAIRPFLATASTSEAGDDSRLPATSPATTHLTPLANSGQSPKNISVVDDLLIGVGSIGTLLASAFLYAQDDAGVQASHLIFLITLSVLLASFSLLVLGIIARRREKACLRLLKLMQHIPETQISVLLAQSRFTMDGLRRAVNTINSAGIGFFVLDEQGDRLYDGRLQARITLSHDCPSCGASTEITVEIQARQNVVCSYCHSPFPVESINALRQQRHRTVAVENRSTVHQTAVNQMLSAGAAPSFSIGKCLLLCILFWPAALFYVAKYHLSTRAHAARLEALIHQQKLLQSAEMASVDEPYATAERH